MGKNLQLYFDAIGQRESSGNYKADNKIGFIGKYQMGKLALTEAGYYKYYMKILIIGFANIVKDTIHMIMKNNETIEIF